MVQPPPAYPLKKGVNGRYLVDSKGVPFLIAGDAPQGLMVKLSEAEADLYCSNRVAHGFNAVWINLLCRPGTGGRQAGATYDGILPFTTTDDLSTPNEAYFARCDRMLGLAEKHGLLVILDPAETIDHLKILVANGPEKCRAFGRYLGQRYKVFPNLVWMSGNDFQTWREPRNDEAALAVARGIHDTDPDHLQTVELNYEVSGSLDDPNWEPLISLSCAYTYYPTYAQVLTEYNRPNFLPVIMIESDYEFEQRATPAVLRRQEYWSILAGATGQVYGSGPIWPFKDNWKSTLDSTGAVQMAWVKALFEPRRWFDLVPDQNHKLVVGGYGTFDGESHEGNHYVMTSDYVTAGRTPDGKLAIAYMPSLRPLKVDLSQLSGPVTARWYDPSRGTYSTIQGSPFRNSGQTYFIPPGNNADGDGDWVLVLEASESAAAQGRANPEAGAPGTLLPQGFLSARGSQIVGPDGTPVRIASVGLTGMNVVGGRLQLAGSFKGIDGHVAAMQAFGFNCVRVDWIDKTLDDARAMLQLDAFVAACKKIGLKVIFDNHNNEATRADWENAAQQKNGLWFDTGPGTDGTDGAGNKGTVSAERFQEDWVAFARHWVGNPTVIGLDIRNEPCAHTKTPAIWGGGGPTDIHAMYESVGNAILAVNPDALIICEAVINYNTGAFEGDLSAVRKLPVVLSNPAKLVYSVHEYPKEIGEYKGPESGDGYIERMNKTWGWLIKENVAPVWIGEMGASMSSEASRAWGQTLLDYMNGKAPGGPTFTGNQQPIGGDWWAWGCLTGQNPNGCVGEDGKVRPEQAPFIKQMLFKL
jgi:hypothetical protein